LGFALEQRTSSTTWTIIPFSNSTYGVHHDPALIARNGQNGGHQFRIASDLTGQVCSDSIGTYFYSGIGGQVDFLRGASRSKGASRSLLCHPPRRGDDLRITPNVGARSGRGHLRGLIRYVVTEYGVRTCTESASVNGRRR